MHIALAALSVSGFALRWTWRMQQSALAMKPATRIIPHLVDTLFLVTAIWMIALLQDIPISEAWLMAKISGLIAYIILGVIAMRTAPRTARSVPAFLAALLVFGWVLSVAFSKSPLGIFAG